MLVRPTLRAPDSLNGGALEVSCKASNLSEGDGVEKSQADEFQGSKLVFAGAPIFWNCGLVVPILRTFVALPLSQ